MQKLVGLNFEQEAREADLRYGLVRVRENAESIAFYNGASSEVGLLAGRLGRVVANYRGLVAASRNLDFFQSAYRYIIILLPAAVVAPLYFKVLPPTHGSAAPMHAPLCSNPPATHVIKPCRACLFICAN